MAWGPPGEVGEKMQLIQLTETELSKFLLFCQTHRSEVDDSFLYKEDLDGFLPGPDNPTFLLTDNNKIIAAASLMTDGTFERSRKCRFRIFYSEIEDFNIYESLHLAVTKGIIGFNSVYLFLNTLQDGIVSIFTRLGYHLDGYSFLLVRHKQKAPHGAVPKDYQVRPFRPGIDEKAWCLVRNTAFSKLRGSSYPIQPEDLNKRLSSPGQIKDGMIMLYHKEKPVGVVSCEADELEGKPAFNIGSLAIIPEYQSQGLGRLLLRKALLLAEELGFDRQVLCVNAENENAKRLYEQEGFVQIEAVGCYNYLLKG